MGAGQLREIRDRISSVKNTQKITDAMRLVAAAKVRRAQDAVLRTRPFSEVLQKVLGGLINRLRGDFADLPLLAPRETNKVLLVVITGDRGLCGGYNNYVIKKTENRIKELKAAGVAVELITIGLKGQTYFKSRETPINRHFLCTQAPTAEQATSISDQLLAEFLSGDADRIELVYTRFVSLIASEAALRTILPLSPQGLESEEDEIFQLTTVDGALGVKVETVDRAAPEKFPPDMIFEQDPLQILNAILPLYLNGQILRTLQESVASELAARMSAMSNASDNAKELGKDLSLTYNRGRQAAITQEISEICAGAMI
ncbi:chloroplast F-type ATPase CF1 subunit gamma, precursor [Chondrus crispus]|uniref:F-ATPase gamma subunit n=1 Tax=Chondrus crispus TaxID=2769 RepID=R7QTA3_CHOCR|nr:chloroplast F-type ATPase CF1 subunit gamma, precursor [Chondrus crispus]CDF40590.1 chloroplast F-type ATPase CF1 subunit gamma, precursor [Chondrus crispus]|eukprot:XP_005710884.1 chloroplast F-type ATPase CF1 subunit gamma, precursor [Chondrus crispus]